MKCAIKDCENQVSLLCLSCHALISGEGLPSQAYRNSRRMIETALIKQPEQEPVAWVYNGILHEFDPSEFATSEVKPLYTAPPKREWVGLTDEELEKYKWAGQHVIEAIKEVQATLKEKNNG